MSKIDENHEDWGMRPKGVRILTEETSEGVERTLVMIAGYNFTSKILGKNFGTHGVEMEFGVRRGDVGITWLIMTDWYLKEVPHVGRDYKFDGNGHITCHSPVAVYEGQEVNSEDCKVTGGTCYADGTGMGSHELFNKMLEDPGEIWRNLEEKLLWLEEQVEEMRRMERNFS